MQYELTIKSDYLPNWGSWESAREIIQNARDAEIQDNAPMTVTFANRRRDGKSVGALVVTNEGTTLPKEALLLGHSSKVGDTRLIGRFGEGLKGAFLALLRMGLEVKIRNGSETWIPKIIHSTKFNARVLAVDVTTGHKLQNRVQFEIVGIDESDWKVFSDRLLFIGGYPEHVQTSEGKVLLSPKYKGQIFVKGMFVSKSDCCFGYDFDEADIDRDRKMINDLDSKTSTILARAFSQGKMHSQIFDMLERQSRETSYLYWYLDSKSKTQIAEEFSRKYNGAIPCSQAEHLNELSALGGNGVMVSRSMLQVLEPVLGTPDAEIRRLRMSEKKRYDVSELDLDEKDNFRSCTNLAKRAFSKVESVELDLDKIHVVDFNNESILGTFTMDTGEIRIAKKILKNKGKTMYTLVHEMAHHHGYDGNLNHEAAIGRLMEAVLNEAM
jgi:hypothetical protein